MRLVLVTLVLLLTALPAAARRPAPAPGPASVRGAPVIVLDPGHGGTNAGALGPEAGVLEKRLTLQLAERTAGELRRLLPAARVILTRTRDEYLTLEQRVQRANASRADVFLSLHCNASESRGREGFESFILSRDASDQEAARLAQQENGGAAKLSAPRTREGALRAILSDLHQANAHLRSLMLARAVERQLVAVRGQPRSRGIKQAPFDVLMGLRMPGVLVEVGYIDHPVEGPQLADASVQQRLARALAVAVGEHLAARSVSAVSRR